MSAWMTRGACKGQDPRHWFPDIIDGVGEEWFDDGTIWQAHGDTSEHYTHARSICQQCPVKDECLAFAFEERQFYGMWGGLTPIERRRIERSQRRKLLKESRSHDQ